MNRATPRGLVAALTVFAVLGASSAAGAITDKERWAASQALTKAQELKKQGNLQEALTHYQESARIDPKLVTLMELAECEEQLGKLLEAQGHFADARDKAVEVSAPQTKKRVEEKLAALEKRVPNLTLQLATGAPAGTQVFRNDALVDAAVLGSALPANPGEYSVVVKAPGHDDAKFSVKLAEGDNQTLPIAVGPATAAAAPPPPPPPPPPPKPVSQDASLSTEAGHTRRTLGLVAGSVGVVGIGAGSFLWYLGWRDGNSLGPTADQQLLAGQISVIAGSALLVTGVVLFATAPNGEAPTNTGLRVTPLLSVGQNATLLGAAGAF